MADNRLSAETIRAEAAKYPDWDPESVVRIAWRESKFIPTAFADDSDDLSYGLMQLNMKPGTADIEQLREMYGITRNEELFNPVVNIRAAHVLWQAGGKSFGPGWNVVPPVATYPTSGGSTSLPSADDQGNPISTNGFTPGEIALLKVWDSNGNGQIDKGDITDDDVEASDRIPDAAANKLAAVAREYAGAGGEIKPGFLAAAKEAVGVPVAGILFPDYAAHLKRATINRMTQSGEDISWTIPGVPGLVGSLDNAGDLVGGIAGITDWAAGLSKLLQTLNSLGFWKKVGVGVLAFLLIVFAVAMFNKDKAMTIITKGKNNG